MNFQRQSYFTLGLLAIMLATVIYALRWPLRTNILILLIGGTAVILLTIQLCKEVFSKESSKEKSSGMDVVVDESQKGKEAIKRILVFWGWLVGLFFGIWLIGFPAAVTLFAFLYPLLNGSRWYWSLFIAMLCLIITYGLFEMVMHAPWPEPFLLKLITG